MSGFQHAPVTKGCILLTGTASLVIALADLKPYVHLQWSPHMSTYHQYWRLLVHPLAYTNSVELLMALLTFYHLGVHVERSFGTRKFASFLFLASLCSTLAAFTTIVLGSGIGVNVLPAGSFGVLGAIWYQYHRMVPSLYTLVIFGVPISNKCFTYLYPLLLLLHQFPTSLIAVLPGLIFSALYTSQNRTRTTPYRLRLRLPRPLVSLLTRLLTPLVDPAHSDSAAPRRADRVLPGEISESAAQARARLDALQRQVRQAQQVQEGVRREVERGAVDRRRNVGRALEALQARLATQAGQNLSDGQGLPPAATATTAAEPTLPPRRSRFGLGGWVDRAGEAVGLRTESPAAAGAGVVAGEGGTQETPLEPVQVEPPRAPTQQEVDTIVGMFPNLSRDAVVRALQTSNYNTALAVEVLLAESP
ncbi:hypothetical protein NCC49_004645 [Naganishia albida]|nr:hypothetical protein NCC49_004645 [Naganishia albida]